VSASRPSDDREIDAVCPILSGRIDRPDRSMYCTYPLSATRTMSRSLAGVTATLLKSASNWP